MDFEAYVATRGPALLTFAYVLTGDAQLAEDLTQTALGQAYRHWRRVERADHPDAYVRKVLVNAHLSWRRRRSSTERPTEDVDPGVVADPANAAADRDETRRLLDQLPPRARAILVLRYYADLDDASIADLLVDPPEHRPRHGLAGAGLAARRSPPRKHRRGVAMTADIEQDLRQLFAADAAHAPVPHDLADGARRRAHRQVKRQRRVAVLACAGVAALLVGGFAVLQRPTTDHSAPAATGGPDASAAVSSPSAPSSFGPVVPREACPVLPQRQVPVPAAMLDPARSSRGCAVADAAYVGDRGAAQPCERSCRQPEPDHRRPATVDGPARPQRRWQPSRPASRSWPTAAPAWSAGSRRASSS